MIPFQLVIGTKNAKKLDELQRFLRDHPIEVATLEDFPPLEEPEETGSTFSENSELKAVYYAQNLQRWVLAEDSGLSVAALDAAPGVYSARFSGEHATDESNNKLLIDKIRLTPSSERFAWYTCHITVVDPEGKVWARSEDYCRGQILDEPRGEGGFGYDPLFEIPEYGKTFAELGGSVKAVLSHRARAYRKLLPKLIAISLKAASC